MNKCDENFTRNQAYESYVPKTLSVKNPNLVQYDVTDVLNIDDPCRAKSIPPLSELWHWKNDLERASKEPGQFVIEFSHQR